MFLLGGSTLGLKKYSVSSSLDDDEIFLDTSSSMGELPSFPITEKSIILDMDLTLICTIGDGSDLSHRMRTKYHDEYSSLKDKGILVPTTLTQFGGSGKAMNNDVIKRPGVDEFLNFCRIMFKHVILWSAGQANYVYDVVKLVLDPDDRGLFDRVYTAQDIVHKTDSKVLNFSTKPIEKITEHFPDITLETTIIVDDLQCNFSPNPRNGVLIPPFSPGLTDLLAAANTGPLDNISGDHYLFSLLHFLADDDFLKIQDVRNYDLSFFRRNILDGGGKRK